MSDTPESKHKKKRTSAERRARTAFLKAEREARRLALEESWQAQVATHFGYLETAYSFRFVSVDASRWWGTYVHYQSPLLQVSIIRSVESNGVELELVRLEDGQVPQDQNALLFGTPVNLVYFWGVLHHWAPEVCEQLQAHKGLSDEQLNHSLALHADALRTYFDGVLRGDLTIFDEATEERRHRQQVKQVHQEAGMKEGGVVQPGEQPASKPV